MTVDPVVAAESMAISDTVRALSSPTDAMRWLLPSPSKVINMIIDSKLLNQSSYMHNHTHPLYRYVVQLH